MIPIGVSVYKREKYLDNIINELVRTKINMNLVHIFDDGTEGKKYFEKLLDYQDKYQFTTHFGKHVGHAENFIRIGEFFKNRGFRHYFYIEDDAKFSLNWYKYAITILTELISKGFKVGVLALYCGHDYYNENKVMKNVTIVPLNGQFYGACAYLMNTVFGEMGRWVMKGNNPDIALQILSHTAYLQYKIFVCSPCVVQHIGVNDSLMNAPHHKTNNFYGENKDAMELL